jgi:hypothetical protein
MLRNENLKIFYCVLCVSTLFILVFPYSPAAADSSAGWGIAELVEHKELQDAYNPKIVMNSAGDAMAVWSQTDGSVFSIWANRYIPGYGWEEAGIIEYDTIRDASQPDVAINDNGDAIAVYRQYDGIWNNIWANHYTNDQGWGDPQLLELNNTQEMSDPQVSMNDDGDAVVVWHSQGIPSNISACNYTEAGGWSSEELIESENINSAINPKVAMDDGGNAISVFRIWKGSMWSFYANRFVKGAGWGSEVLIEDNDMHDMVNIDLAIDDSGNAIAVMQEYDNSLLIYNISWNRYEVGIGWGNSALLESYDVSSSNEPDIAMNALGDAVAIWKQFEGGQTNLYARRYTPSSGWDLPVRVAYTESVFVLDADVTLSDNGDATAVWSQNDFRYNIYANHSTAGSGWGTATLIETNNVNNAHVPEVASDANGNAIAIWQQLDETYYSVWSNHFVKPDITSPTLSITNPISGSIVDIPTVTVSGTTEYGVHLVVNGVVVEVEQDGSFEFQMALSEGANVILATSTDSSDNSASDSTTVTYEKPDSELEQKLQEIWDDLNETEDELNSTQEQLDIISVSLGDTIDELMEVIQLLTEIIQTLNTTLEELDITSNELNQTEDDLATQQIELNATKTQIQDLENELEDVKEDKEDNDSQDLMMLLIPIVVLIILIAVLFILYLNLAKKMGNKGHQSSKLPEESPPSETEEGTPESEEGMEGVSDQKG